MNGTFLIPVGHHNETEVALLKKPLTAAQAAVSPKRNTYKISKIAITSFKNINSFNTFNY